MLTKVEATTPSVPKKRAADIAYDAIESMIVSLDLKPGAPIVESELVERTGLGRTPLREALMLARPQSDGESAKPHLLVYAQADDVEHVRRDVDALVEQFAGVDIKIKASAAGA